MHRPWSMDDCAASKMVNSFETGGGRRVAVSSVRQRPVSP
jgi:hypothetical protein